MYNLDDEYLKSLHRWLDENELPNEPEETEEYISKYGFQISREGVKTYRLIFPFKIVPSMEFMKVIREKLSDFSVMTGRDRNQLRIIPNQSYGENFDTFNIGSSVDLFLSQLKNELDLLAFYTIHPNSEAA